MSCKYVHHICIWEPRNTLLVIFEVPLLSSFYIYFFYNYLFPYSQPVFSSSVLAEMMRPDGSSTIPVLSGESLSAELALELLSIQVKVEIWVN